MNIHIPGKTFLLGEYAVLQGGTALIACTMPYFTLTAIPSPILHSPFHIDSPAGKLLAEHSTKTWHLTWSSPYPQGGFGGSTAEFLACYRLYDLPMAELYTTYLKYAYNGIGVPPSGADLMAQSHMQSSILFFQSHDLPMHTIQWPFEEISLLLFKTSHKLPTHQYLASLTQLPDLTALSDITHQGYTALQQKNGANFIQAINDYAELLANYHLTAESTQIILNTLKQHPACLAAKGCGALGADVIAMVINSHQEHDFIQWFQHNVDNTRPCHTSGQSPEDCQKSQLNNAILKKALK